MAPVAGMVSGFLIALTLSQSQTQPAGVGGAALFLILPLVANLLYQNLWSLSDVSDDCGGPARNMRPSGHTSKVSGPPWEDPWDEELRHHMVDIDSNFTWVDRVTWLCFAGGAIIVLILLVR